MADYLASRIEKPQYFKRGPLQPQRGHRVPYVIGFDSEAEKGLPFLFQFAHPDQSCDLIDVPLPSKRAKLSQLDLFLTYLRDNCKRQDLEYVVFAFNLQYEYTQLFADVDRDQMISDKIMLGDKASKNPSYMSDGTPFYLEAYNMKRYAINIEFGGSKRRIKVIDAMAYFVMSLDSAAKAIGAGHKLAKPKTFSRASARTKDFEAYAQQDAILTQRLGEYIMALHKQYDVSTCMTAPQFACKTFRRAYLSAEIPLDDVGLEQAGLDSYHGGKNGFYLDKPMRLENIYHVDIRSAYPEAMRALPDIERSEWEYKTGYIPSVHGLWHIRAIYRPCKYRCLLGRSEWLQAGTIDATVTSYELDTSIAHGELDLLSCEGWILTGPPNGALTRYVDDFYALKRYAKSPAEKTAAKLFLNSLYGKFFQKVPVGAVTAVDEETLEIIRTDPDERYDYIAGGLYHPPIASLITGFVRAKIHGLEHRYQALMTSTDGMFTYQPPDPADVGEELGQLSVEQGTLTIWRERLYVFDASDGTVTFALHGWRASLAMLRRVPLTAGNLYHYTAQQMMTLRMALRRHDGQSYAPGVFAELPFTLKLGP